MQSQHVPSAVQRVSDLLFSPFILTTDLLLFLGREVVLDVERLSNLFRRLALDHVGDRFATDVEKCFDVKVVCGLCDVSSPVKECKFSGRIINLRV